MYIALSFIGYANKEANKVPKTALPMKR